MASLLLAIACLLAATRLCGMLARFVGQPPVLGELVAGVLLGPTMLGRVAPGAFESLFPASGPQAGAFQGLTTLSIVLFLAVAGLEIDLGRFLTRFRIAASVGVAGIVVPFAIGFGCAWARPLAFGAEPTSPAVPFALFLGTALAISALPVIAKTLVDLDLYRTDLGTLVMGAAVFNDLIGWTLFGLVVGLFGHSEATVGSAAGEITATLTVVALALTAGRWAVQRALAFVDAHSRSRDGVVVFVLCVALGAAALTEGLGHGPLMGAFLSGVVMGGTLATSPGRLLELERPDRGGVRAALLRQPGPAGRLRGELRPGAGRLRVRDRVSRQARGLQRRGALERAAGARSLGRGRGHERARRHGDGDGLGRAAVRDDLAAAVRGAGGDGARHLGHERPLDEPLDRLARARATSRCPA
jgi:Kef-type K+ transport system membrane component KefB